MANLTDEQLMQIIAGGESDRVEFKESLTGEAPRRIREAVCAFANDLPDHCQPGYVLVGVNDRGEAAGAEVTDDMIRRLADIKTDGNILPPPSMTVEKRTLAGKQIALITVQVSDSPPVRCYGSIMIRIGSQRVAAAAQDERILNEKRRHRDTPNDLKPIASAGLSDLNLASFEHEYLPQALSEEALAANQRSLKEKLATAKMIDSVDQPLPTILGLLVLGKDNKFLLPDTYIQFLRMDGSGWADPVVDEAVIRGTIGEQIKELDIRLRSHNRKSVEFVGIPREKQTYLYPPVVLEQITRNAIMHRTYEGTYTPVYVRWFDDRIEVSNPGGPFGSVTAENFGDPGRTAYRNPNVADAMRILDLVQRFGQGFHIAKEELEKAGNPPLSFKIDNSNITVIIKPNVNYLNEADAGPFARSLFSNGRLQKNILDPHEQYILKLAEEIEDEKVANGTSDEIYNSIFRGSELTTIQLDKSAVNIEVNTERVLYYIPFSGNRDLLLYRPAKFYEIGYVDAELRRNDIVLKLDMIDSDDLSILKNRFESYLDMIGRNIENINKDVVLHVSSLREKVIRLIQKRKEKKPRSPQSIAEELGFPLRRGGGPA